MSKNIRNTSQGIINILAGDPNLTIGPIGASPNANGGSISTNILTLQPADSSNGGVLTNDFQSISGVKSFANGIRFDNVAPSAFIVNRTFTYMFQANFGGGNVNNTVTVTGCAPAGAVQVVCTNLMNVCSLSIQAYLPVAGTYVADLIYLNFPGSANTSSPSHISFPGALPTEFAGGTLRNGTILVVDNGVVKLGAFYVDAGGYVAIGAGITNTGTLINFTANGRNGWIDQVVHYF